jgi:hypothetical protein
MLGQHQYRWFLSVDNFLVTLLIKLSTLELIHQSQVPAMMAHTGRVSTFIIEKMIRSFINRDFNLLQVLVNS